MKKLVITLNGSPRALSVSGPMFRKFFLEETKHDQSENPFISMLGDHRLIESLVYCGMKTQYFELGRPLDFTKERVRQWIINEGPGFMEKLLTKLSAYLGVKETAPAKLN